MLKHNITNKNNSCMNGNFVEEMKNSNLPLRNILSVYLMLYEFMLEVKYNSNILRLITLK